MGARMNNKHVVDPPFFFTKNRPLFLHAMYIVHLLVHCRYTMPLHEMEDQKQPSLSCASSTTEESLLILHSKRTELVSPLLRRPDQQPSPLFHLPKISPTFPPIMYYPLSSFRPEKNPQVAFFTKAYPGIAEKNRKENNHLPHKSRRG